MSDTEIATATPQPTAVQVFAREVSRTASRQMAAAAQTPEGRTAISRVTSAFLSAIVTAKKPAALADIAQSRPESIAACVALSMQTRLYPGGPNADVYLVPQSGELQWRITHRGLCKIAARAGYSIMAVPVSIHDRVVISVGELVEHEQDPDSALSSLSDLLGVAVVIRRLDTGAVIARPWVRRAIIEARRAKSAMGNAGPWKDWPIEMAQKSAILYCAARGTMPMESQDIDAVVAIETSQDVVTIAEVEHE